MERNQKNIFAGEGKDRFEATAKQVVSSISSSVRQKYAMIHLDKVPDHVNYSKVEKYLRSINVEITRRMFISYLNDELLPGGHEVKNSNFSYYTRDQIITYILIDMFKPLLPLNKVKLLLNDVLRPMTKDMGVDSAYATICEMIFYMVTRFEEAVTAAIKEEELGLKNIIPKALEGTAANDEKKVEYSISYYTNLVTLCMAKGALDFYKFSPGTLLE
jgi:hypothetical protein